MESIKDLIRNSTAGDIILNISNNIQRKAELAFDPLIDLIYWDLYAPIMNHL